MINNNNACFGAYNLKQIREEMDFEDAIEDNSLREKIIKYVKTLPEGVYAHYKHIAQRINESKEKVESMLDTLANENVLENFFGAYSLNKNKENKH